jgi:Lytic polysaccharide mono-oxygenase, cellulose-degrading
MKDSRHEIKGTCEAKTSHGKIVIPMDIQVKLGTPILHCEEHPEHEGGIAPYHGEVMRPKSRCASAGLWCNGIEVAKFFPAEVGNLADQFRPGDVRSAGWIKPPPDGQIASGGLASYSKLDETGRDRWPQHDYPSGSQMTLEWLYSTRHKTRRFNYFITHPDWDPNLPLSREQFRTYSDDKFEVIWYPTDSPPPTPDLTQTLGYYNPECRPFHSRVSLCSNYSAACGTQPFSAGGMWPDDPDEQTFTLPHRQGYHVILCVWEVADAGGMAFYSTLDINFT